jgi:hypothetical protein
MLLVEKPEGKRPQGRPGRSWVDNIKISFLKMGWGVVDWACSTKGAKRNSCRLLV